VTISVVLIVHLMSQYSTSQNVTTTRMLLDVSCRRVSHQMLQVVSDVASERGTVRALVNVSTPHSVRPVSILATTIPSVK